MCAITWPYFMLILPIVSLGSVEFLKTIKSSSNPFVVSAAVFAAESNHSNEKIYLIKKIVLNYIA